MTPERWCRRSGRGVASSSSNGTSRPTSDWFKAYLERIPVVEIDGTVAFELFVTEPELEARLAGLEPG